MRLKMRDGQGGEKTIEIQDVEDIATECQMWAGDGEWGNEGALISVNWWLFDDEGVEIKSGTEDVQIDPDHKALTLAAGGNPECEHDWSSEGEGGCTENPGVWSTGGTTMVYSSHCTLCGLHRVETQYGSQRNPEQHDTVQYEQRIQDEEEE